MLSKRLFKTLLAPTIVFTMVSKYQITKAEGGAYVGEPTEEEKLRNEEIGRRKDREEFWLRTLRASNNGSKILDVPTYYQETEYYCGPAVAQMIIKYVTGRYISQDTFAADMGTTKENGTSIWSLVSDMNQYRGVDGYYVIRNTNERNFFDSLQKTVDDNHPIVILINHTKEFDEGFGFDDGHFIVGRGYHRYNSDKMVYFTDPYKQGPTGGRGKKTEYEVLKGMKHKESGRGFFAY